MALALLVDMLTILPVIYFRPDLGIIDPICTFVFSVLVLATTIKILRDTVGVLMEATPAVRFSFLFFLSRGCNIFPTGTGTVILPRYRFCDCYIII
jgi:hypothetical protein